MRINRIPQDQAREMKRGARKEKVKQARARRRSFECSGAVLPRRRGGPPHLHLELLPSPCPFPVFMGQTLLAKPIECGRQNDRFGDVMSIRQIVKKIVLLFIQVDRHLHVPAFTVHLPARNGQSQGAPFVPSAASQGRHCTPKERPHPGN